MGYPTTPEPKRVNRPIAANDDGPSVGVRRTQVEEFQDALGAACERLEKSVAAIDERIEKICTHAEEAKCSDACPPDSCLVPLADFLRSRTRAVNAAADRLDYLRGRVEL